MARRVGSGELSARVALTARDELQDLAIEMNRMAGNLQESQARLLAETNARVVALEQLRHADRLSTVGKLASGVAHEFGTPLAVVRGRAEMVAHKEVTGDEAAENARIIMEQADRMAKITRGLLDFARRKGPRKAPSDLCAVIRKATDLLEPMARKRNLTIEVKGVTTTEPMIAAMDPEQIQQVLMNLMMNGIQAMDRAGTITVDIGREHAKPPDQSEPAPYLYVRITDRGIGIKDGDLDHVFEPFFTTKEVGEGTGLGLPVCYGIVQEHGGFIDVKTKVGEGSSFTVYLPEPVRQA